MKKILTDNLGLKILSVLVAMVLWVIVTSINDPTTTRTFYNIPVTLENTDSITSKGQVYEVLDNSNVIPRVQVRAPQSVFTEFTAENIVAKADVLNLSSMDTATIQLDANIYQDQISSITGSIDTVKLSIENQKSKALPISTEITGTPADGYIAGDYSTDQNQVRLSGPESVIDRAVSAKVTVDVSGFSSDVRTNAEIRLYDEDGNSVTSDSLTQNIRSVTVSVAILMTKEVPVNFIAPTAAQAGYRGTGLVEADRTTAYLSGRPNIMKNVESVNVPADAIDISGQSENFTTTVDITPYLPDGVSFVNPSESVYTVTVYIEAEASRRISIAAEDISIVNVPEGYHVTLSVEDGTMLELIGLSASLAELTKENIAPTADIAVFAESRGMSAEAPDEGFFNTEVQFTIPSGVTVLDEVYATLHIVKDEEGEG